MALNNHDIIRYATANDIEPMVQLSYEKRRAYEKTQPQFWKYAKGAEDIQSLWFHQLLNNDDYILLVAEFEKKLIGFIIGQLVKPPEVYDPGGLTLMVDDFCVKTADDWTNIGHKLLRELKQLAKSKGAVQTIVVSGAHDQPKREFLKQSGLEITSEWYVGTI